MSKFIFLGEPVDEQPELPWWSVFVTQNFLCKRGLHRWVRDHRRCVGSDRTVRPTWLIFARTDVCSNESCNAKRNWDPTESELHGYVKNDCAFNPDEEQMTQ